MLAASFSIIRSITLPFASRSRSGFRDVIVPLAEHENRRATNAYALSLAREFGASVSAIAFAFDPIIPVSGPFDAVPGNLIEELAVKSEASAKALAAAFEADAKASGLQAVIKLVHAGFRESEEQFAEAARSFDLAVVPQNKADDETLPNFAEAVLFHSGRPVLVVPYIQRDELTLARVLIGWDGSRAAARAVSDAWPILERAKSVNVVSIGHGERTTALQKEFGEHLAKHGVRASLNVLACDDIDAGNAILSHAADIQADLLVLGGYGHSRLREWVLGGVTRTVLQTMTIPTLLSH
jgi:nucleotide-binding universal stress UspA family protein